MRNSGTLFAAALAVVLILPFAASRASGGDDRSPPTVDRGERTTENVFVIVIDGIRNSEGFKDPAHDSIPRIWNDLRPLGTIYTNFFNLGKTATTPGHAAMTSGVTQFINNRIFFQRPTDTIQNDPSFFQYLRTQQGTPQDKMWMVNGKGEMITFTGICLNPLYKGFDGPKIAFNMAMPDLRSWRVSHLAIDGVLPKLVFLNFRDVDKAGHIGDWKIYLKTIKRVDSYIHSLCMQILNHPHYRGKTAIFITSDHGRHLDNVQTGFNDHGCSCLGCRDIPFLVIGPGVRQDAVVSTRGYLRDIAPTVAHMLGFEAKYANGRVLREIFTDPPPPVPDPVVHPVVARGNGTLHVAYGLREDELSGIFYVSSTDNGATWSQPLCLSSGTNNVFPSIVADGDSVGVAWSALHANGMWKVTVRESPDGGSSWSPSTTFQGNLPYYADMHVDLCYDKGDLVVVWAEIIKKSLIHFVRMRNGTVVDKQHNVTIYSLWPRCAALSDRTHIVFQRLSATTLNWDTFYTSCDSSGFLPPVSLSDTMEQSLRPDIASDGDGLHVVWAERWNDRFRIVCRNSADGSVWGSQVIVGDAPLGAWRPRIAAHDGTLAVVWEGCENDIPSIRFSTSTDGGNTWSAPSTLSGAGVTGTWPAAHIDTQKMLHVTFMEGVAPFTLGYGNRQL